MEQREQGGAVRVGMRWGIIGGFAGFAVCLLGAVLGVFAAILVGTLCGRRAAAAEAGARAGAGRPGALAGLVGGAVAAPGFLLGAAAGALVAATAIGWAEFSAAVSQMLGTEIPPEQIRPLFLLSLVLVGLLQAVTLVLSSTAAGAWAARK